MRTFLIKVSLITGFVILILLNSLAALAKFSPLHPGNLLFPIQEFSEQQAIWLLEDPIERAAYVLDLVDRRIDDLTLRTGTRYEQVALQYLDKSIDQAIDEVSRLDHGKNKTLQLRLLGLMIDSEEVLLGLRNSPINNLNYYVEVKTKITAYIQLVRPGKMANKGRDLNSQPGEILGGKLTTRSPGYIVSGGLVPFPPGSGGARHEFYPLTGKHALLSCVSCHNSGKYTDTPNACINCHILKRPIPHYSGKCDLCHTTNNWLEIHFDHMPSISRLCSSCHQDDAPANHYNGQCSACHITDEWNMVTFNHAVAGATDCLSCHVEAAPRNHYNGQCSACHVTEAWNLVTFNHAVAGATDCLSCHFEAAPRNHYIGQCSNCHNTSNWANAIFNHTGFQDCESCHEGDRPANHFQGQCSNCHNTDTSWQNAFFDHSGASDCIACHEATAPADHFQGQCSNCHGTDTWKGAEIDHANLTECSSCHLDDRPDNHEPGDCAQCHSYPKWDD